MIFHNKMEIRGASVKSVIEKYSISNANIINRLSIRAATSSLRIILKFFAELSVYCCCFFNFQTLNNHQFVLSIIFVP